MKHEAAKRNMGRWVAGSFLFASALLAPGMARSASTTSQLAIQIRPQVALSLESGAVRVRIRLAKDAEARVWTDAVCGVPKPDARVITQSGSYEFPLSNEPAANVCLASSDGVLHASVPNTFLGAQ